MNTRSRPAPIQREALMIHPRANRWIPTRSRIQPQPGIPMRKTVMTSINFILMLFRLRKRSFISCFIETPVIRFLDLQQSSANTIYLCHIFPFLSNVTLVKMLSLTPEQIRILYKYRHVAPAHIRQGLVGGVGGGGRHQDEFNNADTIPPRSAIPWCIPLLLSRLCRLGWKRKRHFPILAYNKYTNP